MAIKKKMQGMSLVALLVGISIGLFLMAGAIEIFSLSKNTFNKIENDNTTQNNYRFLWHHFNTVLSQAGQGLARFQPDFTHDNLQEPAEKIPGWQFMGCYQDRAYYDGENNQTLPLKHEITDPKIPSTCSAQLETSAFSSIRFFGMKKENLCMSPADEHFVEANLFETASATRLIGKVKNKDCDKDCQGDSDLSCGGDQQHTLYRRIYPYVSGTSATDQNPNDTITVLFRGNSEGTVRDCLNNIVPHNIVSSSTYHIDNRNLQCVAQTPWKSTPSDPITLASNVQNMQILYGEDIFGDGSVNRYVPIDFESLDPNYIVSVQVHLTFQNPKQILPPMTFYLKQVQPLKKYLQTYDGSSFTPPHDGFLRLHLEGKDPEAYISDGSTTWSCEPIDGENSCTKIIPAQANQTYTLSYENDENDKALLEYTEQAP